VQRRRDQDRIDIAVGQPCRLGTASVDVHSGQPRAELRAHRGRRLHGNDVQAAADEVGGQLAGAGAEIEHPLGIAWEQPGDCVGRIVGTRALVQRSC